MLQSNGGDADVAEKLVFMIWERASELRVVITDRAKSAATLMALAANEIIMGSTSELGPIDPQVAMPTPEGGTVGRPAQSVLDGLEAIAKKSGGTTLNPAYYPLLVRLDPALVDFCNKAITRSQQFAEKWLSLHMLPRAKARAKRIAKKLANVKTYTSHGMVIDWRQATKLGLKINYLRQADPLWQKFWNLHLTYEVLASTQNLRKIFEGNKVSLAFR